MTPPATAVAPDETAAPPQAQAAGATADKTTRAERENHAARQRLRDVHAAPLFDLATEPWITIVRPGGEIERLGVADVVAQAHLIRDIAEPHPLVRGGLRRFLGGLTVDLVRRSTLSTDDWIDLVEDGHGLPQDLVDATLRAHADHLWLWHPVSPFLQDPRLVTGLVSAVEVKNVQDIVPDIPSDSSSTWFVKPGDPATQQPLSPADTARWLVARWFYGLPGNASIVKLPGNADTTKGQAGGTFTESVATITHVWRVHPRHLLATLLRNIPARAVNTSVSPDTAAPGHGCAWRDPTRPTSSTDPLYLATTTATATLLAARTRDGDVEKVVRGAIPAAKDLVKETRDTASAADFHRVTWTKNTTKTTGKPTTIRVQPAQRVEVLAHFYRTGLDSVVLSGVVTSGQLWLSGLGGHDTEQESLELLLGSKAGTGASPSWQDVTRFDLPAAYLDAGHPRAALIRSACSTAFQPGRGLYYRLGYAVQTLLRPARPADAAVKGLTRAVQERWLATAAALLDEAVRADSAPDEDWARRLRQSAATAFAETCVPYITSTRYAAPYALAMNQIRPRRTA